VARSGWGLLRLGLVAAGLHRRAIGFGISGGSGALLRLLGFLFRSRCPRPAGFYGCRTYVVQAQNRLAWWCGAVARGRENGSVTPEPPYGQMWMPHPGCSSDVDVAFTPYAGRPQDQAAGLVGRVVLPWATPAPWTLPGLVFEALKRRKRRICRCCPHQGDGRRMHGCLGVPSPRVRWHCRGPVWSVACHRACPPQAARTGRRRTGPS